MPKKTHRVVLTGGHAATTAMAVIEEIISRGAGWEVYWIGAKHAFEGSKIPTLEYSIMPSRGVIFRSIITGRLQKKFSPWTIPSLIKIPIGFLHALWILIFIRPKAVLSFGGFAAFPVVTAAWCLQVPVVIHEQTSSVGRANKYSAFFSKKICLSRESSQVYFPKRKSVLTGNPVMDQIWNVKPKNNHTHPPVLFITGGSRGSEFINSLVLNSLPFLLKEFNIIHQTGYADYERMLARKKSLANKLKERYELHKVINPLDMSSLYERSDIIVARAGANTVSEIMAIKRPSILIPIPWSAYEEQQKNAESAKDYGIALIAEQGKVKGEELLAMLLDTRTHYKKIISRVSEKSSPDKDSDKKVVDVLEQCLN